MPVYLLASLLLVAFSPRSCWARSLQQTPLSPLKTYEWRVTAEDYAPDCNTRKVIMVNNEFQPTLTVTQGQTVSVNVFNDLPSNYSAIMGGISIHWHGLHMKDAQWYDGSSYVTQCPIAMGTNFTYVWTVNEVPGTYMWHDHNIAAKVDGLRGALIVLPANGTKEPYVYDEERTLFLSDWFHATGAQQAVNIQRPFDFNKSTNSSGTWRWIGLPQSVLLNGKGLYKDCNLTGDLGPFAGQATSSITCDPLPATSPDAANAVGGAKCPRESIDVEAGKTYRLRVVNSAALVYMTVCIEGHSVTLVAYDAVPIQPIQTTCFDVNQGQRVDVLLTTSQDPKNYWITVLSQFRIGAPNGYGVLRYKGATATALPSTPAMQPNGTQPWTRAYTQATIKVSNAVINSSSTSADIGWGEGVMVPTDADLLVLINSSQPLLEATGQMRWALNNIATFKNPPCEPIMAIARKEPLWFQQHIAPSTSTASDFLKDPKSGALSDYKTQGTVFLGNATSKIVAPEKPTPGMQVVKVAVGQVVDVVLQNNPAQAFGGEYREGVNRTGQEQHPFHLHGHHFWVLSSGDAPFDPLNTAPLNLINPAYRDTVTLFPGSWVRIRFLADNAGIWPLHCHIWPHMMMGQMMYFAVGDPTAPPANLPNCDAECKPTFKAFSNTTGAAVSLPSSGSATAAKSPTPAKKTSATAIRASVPVSWAWAAIVAVFCLLLA